VLEKAAVGWLLGWLSSGGATKILENAK